jgi:hypothetical protein
MAPNQKNEVSMRRSTELLSWHSAVWTLLLFVSLVLIFEPVQTFLLVCWNYGRDGYFHRGIRLMPVKPPRFTDGNLVPTYMDFLTGMATFILTTSALTALFILFARLWDKYLKNGIAMRRGSVS